jgi:hypothetical protein
MNTPPRSVPARLGFSFLVALLAGCGGSGSGGNDEAKAFPGKYLSAICSSAVRCTQLITQSDCESRFKSLYDGVFKDVLEAEEAGTARYDAATAERCLTGARGLSCDSLEMAGMQNLSEETMMLMAAGCPEVFQQK